MTYERRDFNKEAAVWDNEPGRVNLAKAVAAAIREHISMICEKEALDFGCGTGLLTLELQPYLRTIKGVDSSPGMIEMLDEKVAALNLGNVKTQYLDTDKGDVLDGKYDLIVSSMTLHHIKEIVPLIGQFYRVTKPNGYLCVADLDPDEGMFHGGNNDGVYHCGFERKEMRQFFTEAGYRNIRDLTTATVTKTVSGGYKEQFRVFLMIGQRYA